MCACVACVALWSAAIALHILLAVDMAGVAFQGLVCVCVCVEVGKMAEDIGMTIRKGIVVPFLPCLVACWGFHPYMFFHYFFVTCFCCFFVGRRKV